MTSSFPRAGPGRIAASELQDLLAPALGDEKSNELLTAAAARLRCSLRSLDHETALRILSDLATQPGIVGVAARLAKARLASLASTRSVVADAVRRKMTEVTVPAQRTLSPRASTSRLPAVRTAAPPSSERTGHEDNETREPREAREVRPPPPREAHSPRVTIEEILSATLGAEKAGEAVTEAVRTLGVPVNFDNAQAMRVLELMSHTPGLVGVVARFAKARLILTPER